MCLVLYAASEHPLPLVPWSDARPGFHVKTVEPEAPVRAQFDLPHVYMLGSHEGCGCGFNLAKDPTNAALVAEGERSRKALAVYLAQALATGPIRLFACWSGTESLPRPKPQSLAVARAREGEFWNEVFMRAVKDVPSAFRVVP